MYINILRLLSFFALGAKVATANIEKIEIRGTHYVFADTGEGDEEKCQGECTEDQFCAPLINKCLDKQKTFIIGVSVVAGLILIVCCCCCCCCCHKHRKKKRMNSKKYSEVELSSSSTSSYTSSTSSYSSYSSYNSYSSSATQRSYSPSTPSYSTNTSSSSTNLTDTPFGKQLLEEVKKLDNAVVKKKKK